MALTEQEQRPTLPHLACGDPSLVVQRYLSFSHRPSHVHVDALTERRGASDQPPSHDPLF